MKMRVIAVGLGAIALAAPAGAGAGSDRSARNFKMSSAMTPDQVVTVRSKPWRVPPTVKRAKGVLTGLMPTSGGQISWKITYANIGNPALVIADIHLAKPGQFGPGLARLCSKCHSGQTGVTKIKPGVNSQMSTGNAYVTIITDKYPNGVVRGILRAKLS